MVYVQVNIGRGVVSEAPLSDERWAEFKRAVRFPISQFLDDIGTRERFPMLETHAGLGSWGAQREESAHVSMYAPGSVRDCWEDKSGNDLWAPAEARLRQSLSVIAREYGQEAIGLILSDSELIYPAR